MMVLIGGALILASIICHIIVLIDAFNEGVGTGCFCLLCWFYWLYYALVEFQHENKALIVALAIGGSTVGGLIMGIR